MVNIDMLFLQVKNQEAVISTMTEEMLRSKNSSKEREKEFSSCSKGELGYNEKQLLNRHYRVCGWNINFS